MIMLFRWKPPDILELHVPCILFGVRLRDSPLATRIAANLGFAPRVCAYADRIIRAFAAARVLCTSNP